MAAAACKRMKQLQSPPQPEVAGRIQSICEREAEFPSRRRGKCKLAELRLLWKLSFESLYSSKCSFSIITLR